MWFKALIGYVVVSLLLYLALLGCIWRWGRGNAGHPRVAGCAEAQPGVAARPHGTDEIAGTDGGRQDVKTSHPLVLLRTCGEQPHVFDLVLAARSNSGPNGKRVSAVPRGSAAHGGFLIV